MADSIRKQIVDAIIAQLGGNTADPSSGRTWYAIPGLGNVKINKNRTRPIGPGELPMYSVYFIHEMPKPIGSTMRPVVIKRAITVETRVITNGNDDQADQHCQWITLQMGRIDRIGGLALSTVEAETTFESLEGSEEERTVTSIRWTVEYQTNPADLTKTS